MKFLAKFVALSAAIAQLPSVVGHGGVLSYGIAGKSYKGWSPYNTPTGQTSVQRPWSSYSPITSTTDGTLSCNDNGSSGALQLSATVAAGSQVTAYWNQWPHNLGPLMVYMASCGGACSSFNSASAEWFKIDEKGLISGSVGKGQWALGELIANNNSWTSTIPTSLAPGEYLIRHELLALHTANQPQFYPECAQLVITGSGTKTGSPTVKFPGGYSATDPSINIDLYTQAADSQMNYTIPGPAVWSG